VSPFVQKGDSRIEALRTDYDSKIEKNSKDYEARIEKLTTDYESRIEAAKADERSVWEKRFAELKEQLKHHQEIIKALAESPKAIPKAAQKGKKAE
jgi:hypothetical protein